MKLECPYAALLSVDISSCGSVSEVKEQEDIVFEPYYNQATTIYAVVSLAVLYLS